MGRILAIDFGLRRCGLAVTDPTGMIAGGLETVETLSLISFLEKYMAENQVEAIVVGLPSRLDGSDSHVSAEVRQLVADLQKKFPGISIITEDERFTSRMAAATMVQAGLSRKKRKEKGLVDKVSAVLILQSYLSHNT